VFTKRLEYIFITIIFIAISYLAYSFYSSYSFKNSALPQKYIDKINAKEQEILYNMQKNFGFRYRFPMIITDKIPGRLYGLTSYENGNIVIYLNKKVMQESFEYMIDSVIAHEYAHALMFKLKHFNTQKEGHSRQWQKTCIKLGGKDCQQYVNHKEIIMSKLPFR
jgi:hypothetical protein